MSETTLAFIDSHHSLWNGHLHNIHPSAGNMNSEKPHPHTQTGARGKNGGTHLAITASHQQRMPIRTLMTIGCPIDKE